MHLSSYFSLLRNLFLLFMKGNIRLFSSCQLSSCSAWISLCQFARAFATEKYTSSTEILDDSFGPFTSKRKPLTQEDASEFTSFFLNVLHNELRTLESFGCFKEEKGGWKMQGINTGHITIANDAVEDSAITEIFGCTVRADTLSNGKSRSIGQEPYLVLPLQVSKSVDESLRLFLTEEKVDDTISKRNMILSLPFSLIIGLKRFAFDGTGPTKLNEIVDYPSILTVMGVKYELAAIVEHIGTSSQAGHYICISNRTDGKWRKYDDDGVYPIPEKSELNRQAYMLLYNRIE